MIRFRALAAPLGVAFFLLGCSSAPKLPEDLARGLELADNGQSAAAREAFEKACLAQNTVACFLSGKPVPEASLKRLAVLQGITSADTTEINVLSRKDSGNLSLALWEREKLNRIRPSASRTEGHRDSPWITTTVRFEGLEPGIPYSLVIREGAELRDTRVVEARDLTKATGKFAVASCMDDGYVREQKSIWPELLSHGPDYVFLIGDNTYADFDGGKLGVPTNPEVLWRRYSETRNTLALFRAQTLVPVLALWDDHDYGINNGDRTFPHRDEAARIFRAFFAQSPLPGVWETGPGVSGRLTAFGQQFYFLDGRSFRSPENTLPQTHFGEEGEQWLWNGLRRSHAPAWILSGDQFFGAYHRFESYERQHPESFKTFLKSLEDLKHTVAFLSGDRHLAELMRIEASAVGYPTYEITTSGIHAKVFPGSFKEQPNRRRIAGNDASHNYLILESSGQSGLRFTAAGYGPGKKLLYRKTLQVKASGGGNRSK